MKMKNKRQKAILKDLLSAKARTVKELLQTLDISRETLRKDLMYLEEAGYLIRSFGSIQINESCSTESLIEMGLLQKSRRLELLEQEMKDGNDKRVSYLSSKYHVTTETIRSDLKELEKNGVLILKHGSAKGIINRTRNIQNNTQSLPLHIQKLGRQAFLHVSAGETIFLDGGDVCRFIAMQIPPFTKITIITDSLTILNILTEKKYEYPIKLIQGYLASDGVTMISDNPEQLSGFSIDKSFLSFMSYSSKRFYLEQSEKYTTLSAIAKASKKIYMILDSAKIGKKGECVFDYASFEDKVVEILIDDGTSYEKLKLEFPARYPLVVCGIDYSIRVAKGEKWRIGLLISRNRNQFIKTVHDGILEAALNTTSLSVEVMECENTYESVAENLDKLITDDIDIVVDYSLCTESLYYVGEMCSIKKIPLITVDLTANNAIFFGADNFKAGMIAGENTCDFVMDQWEGVLDNVIIIGKYEKSPPHKIRISATLDYLKKRDLIEPSHIYAVDWDETQQKAPDKLYTILREKYDEKNIILTFSLKHLLSSYEYILNWCNKENTVIVVQNYCQQLGELMKKPDSIILGCVDYDSPNYGNQIVSLIKNIIMGKETSRYQYTTLSWKDKSMILSELKS